MRYLILIALIFTGCIGPTPNLDKAIDSVINPTPSPTPTPNTSTEIKPILDIAAGSKCAAVSWDSRGKTKSSYYKGMALVFARAVCNQDRAVVKIVSAPKSNDDVSDSLSWYSSNFSSLGMKNEGGVDTLRHVYALLIGLGMRESSGRYCCGRDMSADYSTATSAEAGLFQASWGASRKSSELPKLFAEYKAGKHPCFLEVFKEGFSCSSNDLKNWGEGEGVEWQRLTKACPAFAAEYAAVLLRKRGGTKGEFGPLREKKAQLKPECDSMLKQVQDFVEKNPGVCKNLDL